MNGVSTMLNRLEVERDLCSPVSTDYLNERP